MEAVLIVLHDSLDCFEHHLAVGVLHGILQIEVLDRNVVVAELEAAAHGFEVGLFHRLAHRLLVACIPVGGLECGINQECRVIGLRAIERRTRAVVLLDVVGDVALVLFVG